MSEYQLMYLRFLQVQRDFPGLNHDGHGPGFHPEITESATEGGRILMEHFAAGERHVVEREFYRAW